MKNLLRIIIILSFSISYAQDNSVLSIKGNASVSVKPTEAIVSLNIRSTGASYAESVQDLINRVDQLTEVMKEIKFKEEAIITSNFTIQKRYNYGPDKKNKPVYDGNQTLMVRFEQNENRLLEVLSTAASSQADPEINVSFELDNDSKKKVKKQLIKLAVADALEKAELIASETGYKVNGIKEIKYGVTYPTLAPQVAFADSRNFEEVVISNFEVHNLTFSESVDVTYEIKKK